MSSTVPVTAMTCKADAARLLRVSTATITRSGVEARETNREHYFTATQVMGLNDRYGRRVPSELAGELVDHAYDADPKFGDVVEQEVASWATAHPGFSMDESQEVEPVREPGADFTWDVATLGQLVERVRPHVSEEDATTLALLIDYAASGGRPPNSIGAIRV